MSLPIICGSLERMVNSPEHQARVAAIRESVEQQYAKELHSAGMIRRWLIRRQMEAAVVRERRKIEPSDLAL